MQIRAHRTNNRLLLVYIKIKLNRNFDIAGKDRI